MTDAPLEDSELHPGILAAIEANDLNARIMSTIWLDDQKMRTCLGVLCFNDEAERVLILGAWRGVGWAARAARGHHSGTFLADMTFGSNSPTAMSGLAPTIRAEDFAVVIGNKRLLSEARSYPNADPHNLCNLNPEAIRTASLFIARLETHLHT